MSPLLSHRLLSPAAPKPRALMIGATIVLTAVMAVGDYLTGADVAFTALYLAPIAVGAWFGSRGLGLTVSLCCSLAWLYTDFTTRSPPLRTPVLAWNFLIQLSVFAITAALVHALRRSLYDERTALLQEHARALSYQQQLQHAQRLSTVGKLAAGIAHELGTPLNVAGSYALDLENDSSLGVEVNQPARVIREQLDAITRIVRQLVDFAHGGKAHRSQQNVRDVVAASLSLLERIAQKKEVTLAVRGDAELQARLDAGQLQQVIFNLVINAIHAVPARGRVEVTVSEQSAAPPPDLGGPPVGCAVIEVRDDGLGIKPEILPHVFEPFVTTKPVGEGTGLGLAVAYGLVREHQGWMTAHNQSGGGACFTVFLPLATNEPDDPSGIQRLRIG